MPTPDSSDAADRNWRRFVLFRVLFNSRFYYPVLAVLFLDLGLSATQYTLLNFAWALAIVCTDLPAGALADRLGRRPLIVAAAVAMVTEMAVLCVAPAGGGTVLFFFCLTNLSYYLNALVESSRRATVLSFKGLAFNLGYGLVSLLFAFVLRALRDGGTAEKTFGRTLVWLPVGLALALVVLALFFRRHAAVLRQPVAIASDGSENPP